MLNIRSQAKTASNRALHMSCLSERSDSELSCQAKIVLHHQLECGINAYALLTYLFSHRHTTVDGSNCVLCTLDASLVCTAGSCRALPTLVNVTQCIDTLFRLNFTCLFISFKVLELHDIASWSLSVLSLTDYDYQTQPTLPFASNI